MSEDEMTGTNAMNVNLGKLQEMVREGEAWCPWGRKESDTTGRMSNNNKSYGKLEGGGLLNLSLVIIKLPHRLEQGWHFMLCLRH